MSYYPNGDSVNEEFICRTELDDCIIEARLIMLYEVACRSTKLSLMQKALVLNNSARDYLHVLPWLSRWQARVVRGEYHEPGR